MMLVLPKCVFYNREDRTDYNFGVKLVTYAQRKPWGYYNISYYATLVV